MQSSLIAELGRTMHAAGGITFWDFSLDPVLSWKIERSVVVDSTTYVPCLDTLLIYFMKTKLRVLIYTHNYFITHPMNVETGVSG